jgi:hypothetical protein
MKKVAAQQSGLNFGSTPAQGEHDRAKHQHDNSPPEIDVDAQ